jgi:hypothetical protein
MIGYVPDTLYEYNYVDIRYLVPTVHTLLTLELDGPVYIGYYFIFISSTICQDCSDLLIINTYLII